MKALTRSLSLWTVLATFIWLLASSAGSDAKQYVIAGALVLMPPLAVWLTALSIKNPPERTLWRISFWALTIAGWFVAYLLILGRCEHPAPEEWQNAFVARELTIFCAAWVAIKMRTFPKWQTLREVAAGVALAVLTAGAVAWTYEMQSHLIASKGIARWNEIGLPMTEFEKTIISSRENAGSAVMRQVLREQIGTRFYKEGTNAALIEPVVRRSETIEELIHEAARIASAKLPPTDEIEITAQPFSSLEDIAPSLEAAYDRILAAEPPSWASDPHDGFAINVPNFLGLRKFSQLTAAESVRRISMGDSEGAAKALNAGFRTSESLRQNPTLVALMIHVAIDSLLTQQLVRVPASGDGMADVASDTVTMRTELIRRLQMEAWNCLNHLNHTSKVDLDGFTTCAVRLPDWARRIVNEPLSRRQFALAALSGAEHAAILKSPSTRLLPDFGEQLNATISSRYPSYFEINAIRAAMRIHVTLLLREQMELIRTTRARLAAGLPVESRESVVLPGVRWELNVNAAENTVSTRLMGAPEWIVKNRVVSSDFWLLPLDGSVAWKFRAPAHTVSTR